MQAIRSFSNETAIMCAGAFALLLTTAISNYLKFEFGRGDTSFGQCLGQFALPAVPLVLVGVLLAMRSHAATTIVAVPGTLYYLVGWIMLPL